MILFKYLQIIFQLLYIFSVVILLFPFKSTEEKNRFLSKRCQAVLDILGVVLEIDGQLPHLETGLLFVANHISWLDIVLILVWHPVRFVAKKEVSAWPLFGWFAKQINTLFIDRQLKGDSKNISAKMTAALKNGDHICIFPEGTSTNGVSVLEFKPNLFQSAIDANVACQPFSIQYKSMQTGELSDGPAFIGEMGLIESIKNTLKAAPIKAIITITPICRSFVDRKALSEQARDLIIHSRKNKL
jgi:1-acyl-sn-glycerol-3-phosphate acyltransferase